MFLNILLLAIGLVALIRGGDLFVGAAVRIAEFLRMPRLVIGSTIVSLATTTPELTVSIIAAARGNADVAVGNAVGSVICNIGLILGLGAVLREVDVNPRVLRTALFMMVGLGITLVLMTLDLSLERWQGTVLVLAGVAYFAYDFITNARKAKPRESVEPEAIAQAAARSVAWFKTRAGTAVQFLLAAGILVFASKLLVDSAVNIAVALGIPPLVIGLTVVAVGTSLPELMTAIGSARRKVSDLSVGNILGANIANLSTIIGIAAVLTPIRMDRFTQRIDYPVMLGMMVLLAWALWTQHRLTRRDGIALLVFYAAYVVGIVTLALLGYYQV